MTSTASERRIARYRKQVDEARFRAKRATDATLRVVQMELLVLGTSWPSLSLQLFAFRRISPAQIRSRFIIDPRETVETLTAKMNRLFKTA
jgi:hypothetical protein